MTSALRILIASLILLISVSLAHAAVCTATVDDLNFGSVDVIGNVATDTAADVTISCDGITPGTDSITVCGNLGAGDGGSDAGIRQSVAGAGRLGYVLYQGDHATRWGSTDDASLGEPYRIDIPVSGATAATTRQLYATVPRGQPTVPVGIYHAAFSSADAVFTYAEGNLDCASPAGGTPTTASFAVSASVVANCLLNTSDLDFGRTGIIGDNIDAETSLSITCTPGADYAIGIDGGGSADPSHRLLRSGSNTVSYGLYSDPGRGSIWGTATGSTLSGVGDGAGRTYPVYGRIPPQPAVAGAYSDTVVVTITYQ